MPDRDTSATLRILMLSAALSAMLAPAASAAPHERPVAAHDGGIQVSMRDVVLFPYDDVAAPVAELTGSVVPEHASGRVVMDDVTSYRVEVGHAEMRLSSADMTNLMNQHILPSARTPIRHVEVSFGDGAISMSGTMVKLGLPVPFTATATLQPTAAGDLRVHVTAMKAAGMIPKGLIDALGLELSNIAQPANRGVFHIEGDDMIVPVISMFPPPRFAGQIASVAIAPSGVSVVIGKPAPLAEPPLKAASYLHFTGGTLNFARLTMHDTDLSILGIDATRPLAFAPAHYYAQLEAGHTDALPGYALAAYVKDYRDLAPAAREAAQAVGGPAASTR